jgi:hypothetical protein
MKQGNKKAGDHKSVAGNKYDILKSVNIFNNT